VTPRRYASRAAVLALAALPLVACGGTTSTAASPATSPVTSPATSPATSPGTSSATSGQPSPAGTNLSITVRGSSVTPPPASVDVPAGTPVRLTITADRSSEVHVHVVDLEKPINAGVPLTIEFTPTQQGVYEVELHDPDLLLVKLAVR
jgi:plastocyanin